MPTSARRGHIAFGQEESLPQRRVAPKLVVGVAQQQKAVTTGIGVVVEATRGTGPTANWGNGTIIGPSGRPTI